MGQSPLLHDPEHFVDTLEELPSPGLPAQAIGHFIQGSGSALIQHYHRHGGMPAANFGHYPLRFACQEGPVHDHTIDWFLGHYGQRQRGFIGSKDPVATALQYCAPQGSGAVTSVNAENSFYHFSSFSFLLSLF
jgi:hypothetical protein